MNFVVTGRFSGIIQNMSLRSCAGFLSVKMRKEGAVIKPDQYGNPVECDVYMFGVHECYEWVRLSDAEQ